MKSVKPILFVCDDRNILILLKVVFEEKGYSNIGFEIPDKALEYFNNHSDDFSLVLVKYSLPVMNGLTFSNHVRKLNKEIPIVLFTFIDIEYMIKSDLFKLANISKVLKLPMELDLVVKAMEQFIK